jgi:hypothetical protein
VAKRKGTEDICSRPKKFFCSAVNNVPDAQDLQVIFSMLKGIYTMPPRGVLWVMLNGSQKYYKKIIQMYIFIRAEFAPKLFLPEKNIGRVYNRPFEHFFSSSRV